MTKRLGILTGGGDCPGLNAVIRAAVKNAVGRHGWEVIGIEAGFEGLMDLSWVPLTRESIKGILPKGGTVIRTSNRGDPFSYPGEGGQVQDRSAHVLDNIRRLGLDALIVIGGDGSLSIANRLCDLGVPIVAVPKTINNDLQATDYTFGFMTAVSIASEAVDRLHSTAESHDRIMILEVMGRDAGWIALYAGIAGGADVILIPEIPWDLDEVQRGIEERKRRGSRFDIIVVAEGAKSREGEEVYLDRRRKRLGGVAYQVADALRQTDVNLEVRVTVLGHVQRGGSPIPYDRILATRYGEAAVDLVAKQAWGQMVALRCNDIVSVPLRDAVAKIKLVDPASDIVRTARRLGVSFGDPDMES